MILWAIAANKYIFKVESKSNSLAHWICSDLTHFRLIHSLPMNLFSTPWKHQKTVRVHRERVYWRRMAECSISISYENIRNTSDFPDVIKRCGNGIFTWNSFINKSSGNSSSQCLYVSTQFEHRDHPFSTFAKFSEKLTFLPQRVRYISF